MPAGSVVIPACNEASVIDRCLHALASSDVHVVVAANGCTDDTAARARNFGVDVVELTESSKVAALNAGDAACGDLFPRIYLDADIVLDSVAVERVLSFLLGAEQPRVCAPAAQFDLTAASAVVRTFYRAYLRLPYVTRQMVGSGCYAVNAVGRKRWTEFPDITADDLFVQGLFDENEREVIRDARFLIVAPRTLRGLLRVRTRTYRGNAEAGRAELAGAMSRTRGGTVRSAVDISRAEPRMIPSFLVYFTCNAVAGLRARLGRRNSTWLTDSTSRS